MFPKIFTVLTEILKKPKTTKKPLFLLPIQKTIFQEELHILPIVIIKNT